MSRDFIKNGLESAPGGFFIYRADESEEILYANEQLIKIFECDTYDEFLEVTKGSFHGMVHPQDLDYVEARIVSQIQTDDTHFDYVHYRIVTKTGKIRHLEDYGRYVETMDEGPLFYVFVTTSRMKLDPLTGLPNDWYFLGLAQSWLPGAYQSGIQPIILTFNLVGMMGYNDKYGREEGDNLLVAFGNLIQRYFGSEHCSRFGEDHFYAFTESYQIDVMLNELIVELHELNSGKSLPVKIGICKYVPDVPISTICDWARMAAAAKKSSYGSSFVWFDEKMSAEYTRKQYILTHLDQALVNGWIQVYFQPVVRTLSGRVSSAEALVRWIDPHYGTISPNEFIPLLEENGLSYKIDRFVVNRVAQLLQRQIRRKEMLTPVSVNISRSDFELIDPVDMVVKAVDEYAIPRRLIYIEITETALTSDNGRIRHGIEQFHQAGFQVWMDDFGSGYSSLNVLKDYDFDEIKIDMVFMKNFDERVKNIVTMAVQMAKKLGIHTLAEGVETQEHVEFLKSIGCEKMQGYYFGRPMPFEEAVAYVKANQMAAETREQIAFYDAIGSRDLVSDRPLAMFLYADKQFQCVYVNDMFVDALQSITEDGENWLKWNMNSNESPLRHKFLHLVDLTVKKARRENMTFVVDNHYFHFSMELLGESRDGKMFLAEIDTTVYEEMRDQTLQDEVSRNLMMLFDNMYLLDITEKTRTVIATTNGVEDAGTVTTDIDSFYDAFPTRFLYYDDIERFKDMASAEGVRRRLAQSSHGYFVDYFRVRQPNGNYNWMEFYLIALPDANRSRILACVKPTSIGDRLTLMSDDKGTKLNGAQITDSDLVDAFVNDSGIKLFWKDDKRRFCGASEAFLQYYGFDDLSEIAGKTDEEIRWHLNDVPFQKDENEVLETGSVIRNSRGENVVDNVVHNILASKFPIYHEGIISGLMGYFVDIDQDMGEQGDLYHAAMMDPVTGMMNTSCLFSTALALDDNYRLNDEDYSYILMTVPEYETFLRDFGEMTANILIQTIADEIRKEFDVRATIAHMNGCEFGICERGLADADITRSILQCKEHIEHIREINGRLVNLHFHYGIARGSEGMDVRDVMTLAYNRMDEKNEQRQKRKHGAKALTEVDPYNEMPLPFVIMRPIMEDEKNVDMTYIYANHKYCEMTGKSSKELLGHSYLELFPNTSKRWLEYCVRGSKGELIHERAYSGALGGNVELIAGPASMQGGCVFLGVSIENEQIQEKNIARMLSSEEVIIRILTKSENVLDFDDTIRTILNEVGECTKADRAYLLQTDRNVVTCTFEWLSSGVKSAMEQRHDLPYQKIAQWEKILEDNSCIRLDDISGLKETNSATYQFLRSMDIYNILIVPIYLDGYLVGYFGVDNFDADDYINAQMVLETIGKFIGAKFMKREMYMRRMLDIDSKVDMPAPQSITATDASLRDMGPRIERILEKQHDFMTGLEQVMGVITAEIHPDRVVLLERDGYMVTNIYEWCAETVESEKDMLQNLDYDTYCKAWERQLKEEKCIVIEDIEVYRITNSALYLALKRKGVRNMMVTAFYNNGMVTGFMIVENYRISEQHMTKQILEAVVFFIGAKMNAHYFQRINSFDDLTGVHNRNAMLMRRAELKNYDGPVGIVFLDLNGLKEVNDVNGHEAGDQFIRNAANVLVEVYGKDHIYRSGGDEFTIVLEGIAKSDFESKNEILRARLSDPRAPKMAAGFAWAKGTNELDQAIQKADQEMYHDKSLYYRDHERYRR